MYTFSQVYDIASSCWLLGWIMGVSLMYLCARKPK